MQLRLPSPPVEVSHGYQFKVLAWINGTLTMTDPDYIDVNNAIKRQAIVNECKKLISTAVTGSYIAGASRREMELRSCLIFPAFPANANHDVGAENIKYAAPGVDAGLKALETGGDPSGDYFQSAAVFLHTDGTGNDHFANKSTDWWWFSHYWLQP